MLEKAKEDFKFCTTTDKKRQVHWMEDTSVEDACPVSSNFYLAPDILLDFTLANLNGNTFNKVGIPLFLFYHQGLSLCTGSVTGKGFAMDFEFGTGHLRG